MALTSLITQAGLTAAQILSSARHPHLITGVRALAELSDLGTETFTGLSGVTAISLLVLGLHVLADLLESGADTTSRPSADTEGR